MFDPVEPGDGIIKQLGGKGIGEGDVLPVTEEPLVVTPAAIERPTQEELPFGDFDLFAACAALGDDGRDFFTGNFVEFQSSGHVVFIGAKLF